MATRKRTVRRNPKTIKTVYRIASGNGPDRFYEPGYDGNFFSSRASAQSAIRVLARMWVLPASRFHVEALPASGLSDRDLRYARAVGVRV